MTLRPGVLAAIALTCALAGCVRIQTNDEETFVPPGSASTSVASSALVGRGDLWALVVPEYVEDLNGDGDMLDQVLHVYSIGQDEITNLRFAVSAGPLMCSSIPNQTSISVWGERVFFMANELDQGRDLNEDGDVFDNVLHVYDPVRRIVRNLRVAAAWGGELGLAFADDDVLFGVYEFAQGAQDLDGDGTLDGIVLHSYSRETGLVQNLELAGLVPNTAPDDPGGVAVQENIVSGDLNGDGDVVDWVFHVFDGGSSLTNSGLATRLRPGSRAFESEGTWLVEVDEESQWNGDHNGNETSNEWFFYTFDPLTGAVAELDLPPLASVAGAPRDGTIVFEVHETAAGEDLNGDGDTWDFTLLFHSFRTGETIATGTAVAAHDLKSVDGWHAFSADERSDRRDLNQDGDTLDSVLQLIDVVTGVTVNTGLASTGLEVVGSRLALARNERLANADWNLDGDRVDRILFLFDPATQVLENTGWPLEAVLDTNSESILFSSSESAHGRDVNGDGDEDDLLLGHYRGSDGTAVYDLSVSLARFTPEGFLTLLCENGVDVNGDGHPFGTVFLSYPPAGAP